MTTKKRVVIIEDHQLFREGLKAMVDNCAEWEIIGEAADGQEGLSLIKNCKPDLVLLDLSMPRVNGFAVLREIKRNMPDVKMLILSIHETDDFILQAFEAGADGYAIKDCSRNELKSAIQSVLEGKRYLNPSIAGGVIQGFLNGGTLLKGKSTLNSLTARELEVLRSVGKGLQNKQIATMLHISIKTVEKHRANIMTKLDLHNAAALTAFAIQSGLMGKE